MPQADSALVISDLNLLLFLEVSRSGGQIALKFSEKRHRVLFF
jgi:hypothetical protein